MSALTPKDAQEPLRPGAHSEGVRTTAGRTGNRLIPGTLHTDALASVSPDHLLVSKSAPCPLPLGMLFPPCRRPPLFSHVSLSESYQIVKICLPRPLSYTQTFPLRLHQPDPKHTPEPAGELQPVESVAEGSVPERVRSPHPSANSRGLRVLTQGRPRCRRDIWREWVSARLWEWPELRTVLETNMGSSCQGEELAQGRRDKS